MDEKIKLRQNIKKIRRKEYFKENKYPIMSEVQTPLVTETLLKKRRTLEELAYRRSLTFDNQVKVIS